MLARLRSIAGMIFRRSRWEQDLRDELQFHIEERAEHLTSAGLAREEALRRALREFGAVEAFKDGCRDARSGIWVDELSRNLLYAVRSIRNNPGFAIVAVLSLALGIGANLAVFNVLYRLVLTPLPVQEPDHLHQVVLMQSNGKHYEIPYPKFEVMRDNLDVFKPLFGWGGGMWAVSAGDWKDTLQIAGVTGNYFETLGVHSALGRLLTPQDEQAHANQIAVISHRMWRTAFAGDPGVVGRSVKVADATFVVAGVAPAEFTGIEPGLQPAVYLLVEGYARVEARAMKGAGYQWFHVMGRLPAGVALGPVQAMVRERWPQLDEPNRLRFTRNTHDYLVLEDGSRGYSAVRLEFSSAVVVLMGLVAAVFLIACANLATLLLVRGADRLREVSIRFALGAARAQLIRQWMTECLLVSALGGLAGLVSAAWITDLLLGFVPEADRSWLRFEAAPVVVALTGGLTLAAGMLCGLLPALRATRARLAPALHSQSSAATGRRGPVADGILAGQLAASLVLVVGGALFARTLWNLNTASGGFDRKTVVYAIPDFGAAKVPRERQPGLMHEVLEGLRRSPSIAAVSMGSPPMVWADSSFSFVSRVPKYTFRPDEDNTAFANAVSPGFFDVLRIPLIAGRDFDERDRRPPNERPTTLIVNEQFARHYFDGRSPVGETIVLSTPMEIIGVVKDTKNKSLRDDRKDVVYTPLSQGGWSAIVARTKPGLPPSVTESEVRSAFATYSKELPVETSVLEEVFQRALGRDRLVAQLSAALGLLGIVLASIGLYAAIAHSVTSRTREIGIRMAIGAGARDVVWMVLKQSLLVTALGVLIGLPAAIAATRLINSLLFEVSPSDPLTLTASAAVLVLTGLLASWWPARRASRLDPALTLRYE